MLALGRRKKSSTVMRTALQHTIADMQNPARGGKKGEWGLFYERKKKKKVARQWQLGYLTLIRPSAKEERKRKSRSTQIIDV